MKGVSIGHRERAACLLIAFGVPGSWAGGNPRCSVPSRSGYRSKTKTSVGRKQMFYHRKCRALRKGGFSFEKMLLFRIDSFPPTCELICPKSFGNQRGKTRSSKELCRFFSRVCKVQLSIHCSCHFYTVA